MGASCVVSDFHHHRFRAILFGLSTERARDSLDSRSHAEFIISLGTRMATTIWCILCVTHITLQGPTVEVYASGENEDGCLSYHYFGRLTEPFLDSVSTHDGRR